MTGATSQECEREDRRSRLRPRPRSTAACPTGSSSSKSDFPVDSAGHPSSNDAQDIVDNYRCVCQQLRAFRGRVLNHEEKAMVEEIGAEARATALGNRAIERHQHDEQEDTMRSRLRAKDGDIRERAQFSPCKEQDDVMDRFLRRQEEEHQYEKARLETYCGKLQRQARQALQAAKSAQRQALIAETDLEHECNSSRQEIFRLQQQIEELARGLQAQRRVTAERDAEIISLRERLSMAQAREEALAQQATRSTALKEEVESLRKCLEQANGMVLFKKTGVSEEAERAKVEARRRHLREQRRLIEKDLLLEIETLETLSVMTSKLSDFEISEK